MQRQRTLLTHNQDTKKESIATAFERAQIPGLSEKHFKLVIITEYKGLQKKQGFNEWTDTKSWQWNGNYKKEAIGNLELKRTVAGMKF